LRGTRDTRDVGSSTGESLRLGHTESKSERARESDHHGVEAPFPLSRMPASIELSIKLVVCLSARTMSYVMHVRHRVYVRHCRWQESRWQLMARVSSRSMSRTGRGRASAGGRGSVQMVLYAGACRRYESRASRVNLKFASHGEPASVPLAAVPTRSRHCQADTSSRNNMTRTCR
jgi:hypothetical protein